MSDENKFEGTINAVTGLVKAVPVYQDALQPAVKELGKGLCTVAKTVNVALAPLKVLVWGYEQIENFVSTKVVEKLQHVAPEDIITPKPNIAGPLLESLRYAGNEDALRELYAELLASAMNRHTAEGAFPCFVEIIKQMSSDEAKIIQAFKRQTSYPVVDIRSCPDEKHIYEGYMIKMNLSLLGEVAKCECPQMTPNYIDNLCRLGLVSIPAGYSISDKTAYEKLDNSEMVTEIVQNIEQRAKRKARVEHKLVSLTELGKLFMDVCTPKHYITVTITRMPNQGEKGAKGTPDAQSGK